MMTALLFASLVYLLFGVGTTLVFRFRGIPNLTHEHYPKQANCGCPYATWGGTSFEVAAWLGWIVFWPLGWFLVICQYVFWGTAKFLSMKL